MVSHKDLIGTIANFPIPIVERMLFHQEQQGNTRDILIFQNKRDSPKSSGGFNWKETHSYGEGTGFWSRIINFREFKHFFDLYPQSDESRIISMEESLKAIPPKQVEQPIEEEDIIPQTTFILGDLVIVTNNGNIDKSKKERIYLGTLDNSEFPYLAVTRDSLEKLMKGQCADISSYSQIKKVDDTPKIVELTLEDISQGKGVGIDPSLIKIVKTKK